jgi:hypothetical protein
MVFVAHHITGVRLIPRDWLDGFQPSGFREATAQEIAYWHEERGIEPPRIEATPAPHVPDVPGLRGQPGQPGPAFGDAIRPE